MQLSLGLWIFSSPSFPFHLLLLNRLTTYDFKEENNGNSLKSWNLVNTFCKTGIINNLHCQQGRTGNVGKENKERCAIKVVLGRSERKICLWQHLCPCSGNPVKKWKEPRTLNLYSDLTEVSRAGTACNSGGVIRDLGHRFAVKGLKPLWFD